MEKRLVCWMGGGRREAGSGKREAGSGTGEAGDPLAMSSLNVPLQLLM